MLCESVFLIKLTKSLKNVKKVLLGFSGGLDSTVLLHLLVKLRLKKKIEIRAVYIHHGINEKSDDWGIHCKNVCLMFKVKFYFRFANIISIKKGLEGNAREARYKVFQEMLLSDEVLILGHHLDDQVETFLLALKRGSGPKGLSSMKESKIFYKNILMRPLLIYSKNELFFYAIKNNLKWIEDQSNFDQHYDRNFLRHHIIPEFKKRWPFFSNSVFKSANLCAEQEFLLDELLQDCLSSVITKFGTLKINKLLLESSEIKRNVILRRWFEFNQILMPSKMQLKEIWKKIICVKYDTNPSISFPNKLVIRRFRDQLFISNKFNDISKICLDWKSPFFELDLPDGLGKLIFFFSSGKKDRDKIYFRAPLECETIQVKFGLKSNDKVVLNGGPKRVKTIWQEFQIVPWMRKRIPLIYYNDKLISAIDVFVTKFGKLTKSSKPNVYIVWKKNEFSICQI